MDWFDILLFGMMASAPILLFYSIYLRWEWRKAVRRQEAAKEDRRKALDQKAKAEQECKSAQSERELAVEERRRADAERSRALDLMNQALEDKRITDERSAKMGETMNRLVNLDERIRHDVPKRLGAICDYLRAALPEGEARKQQAIDDLLTTIEKIRLHLAPSIKDYVASERNIGSAIDAEGMSIASLVRWIARMGGYEKLVDIEGEEELGMLDKRVFWDLVLSNILSNAVQHRSPDGRVTVTVSRQKDGRGRIDIVNDGQGIPRAEIDRLFSLGHTTKAGGRGLGLFVVKEVVEGMGARVKVVNERNMLHIIKGVRFTLEDLPIVAPSETITHEVAASGNG